MSKHHMLTLTIAALAGVNLAAAQTPQQPQPMKHINIAFDGQNIGLTAADLSDTGGAMPLYNYGETYAGAAAVLGGKGYNDQFGWRIDGIWSPPTDTALFVKRLSSDDGLETYEGGMRMMVGAHTFSPLFESDGDIWQFTNNQMGMHHHWYAAAAPGAYSATYRVYIGDLTGNELTAYGAQDITLDFTYAPEPSSIALLSLATLAAWRRR